MKQEDFLKQLEDLKNKTTKEKINFFENVLAEENDKNDTRVLASFHYGDFLYRQGDFRRVIELIEPIVLNHKSYPYSKTLINCFNLIGVATHCENDSAISRFYYQMALEIISKHDEKYYYSFEYNNIALSYLAQENYREALDYLKMAEDYMKYCDSDMGAYIYLNKAIAYEKLNQLDDALKTYHISVDEYNADTLLEDDYLRCGAVIHFKLCDFDKYKTFKEKILARLDKMDSAEFMEACKELYYCALQIDDKELIYEVLKQNSLYMKRFPKEYKIGLEFAKNKYLYAQKTNDTNLLIDSLKEQNKYRELMSESSLDKRIHSLKQYKEIYAQMHELVQIKEKATLAKSHFLANMSHDIRTPLNGIIGLIKIDEKHFDDVEMVKNNHKKMDICANHLLSLVNDILDMSKIEDESVILSRDIINIKSLLLEIETIVSESAMEKDVSIDFKFNIDDNHSCIYGSPVHLKQIFLNILSNCIKYNRIKGSVSLFAEIVKMNDIVGNYRFTIKDTGIGMSEEYLSHIFEPFTQEENGARSTYYGTGLGMSIVKGLVDKMNGTISVESKKNEGSKFVVDIPFELANPTLIKKEEKEINGNIEGLNILLVEDNEINAEIAKILLVDKGCSVNLAKNGLEALNMFKASKINEYDVILMDIRMPVMDGFEATEEIRSLNREDANTIPIIAMTANAYQEDKEECIKHKMNAHLSKPLDMNKVVNTILENRNCH